MYSADKEAIFKASVYLTNLTRNSGTKIVSLLVSAKAQRTLLGSVVRYVWDRGVLAVR